MDDRTCDCDVAIVGAGPTGLMMALQLGQAGLRVCLLEKRAEPFTTPRAIASHATAGAIIASPSTPAANMNAWNGSDGARSASLTV